jgi:hypothetical protein
MDQIDFNLVSTSDETNFKTIDMGKIDLETGKNIDNKNSTILNQNEGIIQLQPESNADDKGHKKYDTLQEPIHETLVKRLLIP